MAHLTERRSISSKKITELSDIQTENEQTSQSFLKMIQEGTEDKELERLVQEGENELRKKVEEVNSKPKIGSRGRITITQSSLPQEEEKFSATSLNRSKSFDEGSGENNVKEHESKWRRILPSFFDDENTVKIRELTKKLERLQHELDQKNKQIDNLTQDRKRLVEKQKEDIRQIKAPCKEHTSIIESLQEKVGTHYFEMETITKKHKEEADQLQFRLKDLEETETQLLKRQSQVLQRLEEQRQYIKKLEELLKENNLALPDPEDNKKPQKLTIAVTCPETPNQPAVTHTTTVPSDLAISAFVNKLRFKFPGDTTNFNLFFKNGKNSYKRLEEDKTLGSYKELLEVKGKIALEFQNISFFEEKRKNIFSLRKMPSRAGQDKPFVSKTFAKQLEELDDEGQTPFHAAVKNGDIKVVEMFLNYFRDTNGDVNIPDKFGWTCLHIAVSNSSGTSRDDDVLKLLLDFPGIKFDAENQDKNTPLHYFCQKFISPGCVEFGEILIKNAPSVINKRNSNGETPLHKAVFNPAVRILMVNLLIKHGADVNIQNERGGETALHYAVRLARKDLVKILLNAGADTTLKEREGKTPYDLAVATKEFEIADLMQDIQDLYEWLDKLDLKDYFKSFLKDDLLLANIAATADSMIDPMLESLKIEPVGARFRLKQSIPQMRDTVGKKAFERKLKKAGKTPMYEPKPPNVEELSNLKRNLTALVNSGKAENDEAWLIKHSDIEFTKELGTGRFGNVFKGLFQNNTVAIKVLKDVDKTFDEFKKEFHVMSAVRSPYIVHFYGACLEPRICMVMEYCSKGSLNDVLRDQKLQIGWDKGLRFGQEMAAGMVSLHTSEPPIFHRDMKSLNLLVTKQWSVKVCDFGLARFNTADNQTTMAKMCGTYAYLAPEMFHGNPFTAKSDVWSVGIILWDIAHRIITGEYSVPYSEFKHIKLELQILYQVAEKKIRPTIPKNCPPLFTQLIQRCLSENPDDRPDMVTIVKDLQAMQKEYDENPTSWPIAF